MFHNISNPKWFGNWSRLEDDYLGNGGTDISDNFTFSKMEKTGGLFGSIIRLATAFPACDPETGHATGAWKVACESIDLDEVPLSDIADMISGFDCETITDFRLFNTGAFDNTPWQQALGELLLRLRVEKDDYQWIQCPNSESAVNMMNMVMDAHMPKDFFDGFVCGDEEYGLNEEAHEMASGRKEIDTQTETLEDRVRAAPHALHAEASLSGSHAEIRLQPPPARLLHRTGKALSRASCFPGGSRQQPDQGGCSACHPSRDRCLRHPAHRGHQAGRHGKLRGARSGDEYGFERLQQAELHPLLRPVTGYGCLRVRKRQENRSARRPMTMSSMMTMTISQPFQSQKPSKPERKETI